MENKIKNTNGERGKLCESRPNILDLSGRDIVCYNRNTGRIIEVGQRRFRIDFFMYMQTLRPMTQKELVNFMQDNLMRFGISMSWNDANKLFSILMKERYILRISDDLYFWVNY